MANSNKCVCATELICDYCMRNDALALNSKIFLPQERDVTLVRTHTVLSFHEPYYKEPINIGLMKELTGVDPIFNMESIFQGEIYFPY